MTQEQAADLGVQFASEEATALEMAGARWRIGTESNAYEAAAVVFAAGSSMRTLDIPGEEELIGKGVSHCASCDGPLLSDRETVVIGGGDSAMQEALTLAETVGRVVMLVKDEALSGQARYRDEVAASDKIEVRYGVEPEQILGEDAVTGVRAGGEVIAVAAVFPFIGLAPNSALLEDLVRLAPSGRIPTDGAMRTSVQGLLAAGTVRAGAAGRAVAAAGEGAAAAIAADRYLTDGAWPAKHSLEPELA
jgi:thioredoxin reductase (NADPH)